MCLGRPGRLHAYKENSGGNCLLLCHFILEASATALVSFFMLYMQCVVLIQNKVWNSIRTFSSVWTSFVVWRYPASLWGPLTPIYLSCSPLRCCTSHWSIRLDAPSMEGERPGVWFLGGDLWHALVHPASVVLCAGTHVQGRVRAVAIGWPSKLKTSCKDGDSSSEMRFTPGLGHLDPSHQCCHAVFFCH